MTYPGLLNLKFVDWGWATVGAAVGLPSPLRGGVGVGVVRLLPC